MEKKLLDLHTVVDAYPLTQAQRFMYFVFNQYGKNPAVLNIGTGCYWQGEFDAEILKESLYEAVSRCDTMRLRFTPDRKFGLMQYLAEEPGIEIEEVDHSGMTDEESTAIIKKWTTAGTEIFESPLNTIKIMRLPGGYNGFYTKFHHLAFDGYSSKMFMQDAMAIYCHKLKGAPYPKPMKPYMDAMLKELAYFDSPEHETDKAYWMQKFGTSSEPCFNDYLLDNRLTKARRENPDQRYILMYEGDHPESRTFHCDLSAEDSDRLMKMCADNGLSVPSVLMLALRTSLSALNGRNDDVSFKYMIHRRGTLAEKKSGGNRWCLYSIRTIIGEGDSFAEAAKKVEAEQNEIFLHCNFDTLEMYRIKHVAMKLQHLEQTYDTMSFSYHAPLPIPFPTEESKAGAKGIWYNNDYSAQNLYLTIKHRLSDNGLEFIFEYRIAENPLEDLRVLYDGILKTLLAGTENPQLTIGEILDSLQK